MNYSVTIAGLIAAAVITFAKSHHVELPYTSDQITQWVFSGLQFIGIAIAYYGRYRHGDITWYGAKKTFTQTVTVSPDVSNDIIPPNVQTPPQA